MPTQLTINEQALIPAIAQDAQTGAVLMVAHMNHEALTRTIETRQAWFYSRSRQELWHKGETSGSTLNVVEIRPDCDGDIILLKVNPDGPACPHRQPKPASTRTSTPQIGAWSPPPRTSLARP